MKKKKICLLVPAHNEEKVIAETLSSLLLLVDSSDLYVVNDGSIDQTAIIAKRFTKNVLSINPGKGKANALNTGIKHNKLTKKYDYIMPVDADTVVAKDFLKYVLPIFEQDKNKEVACVIGKVVARNHSWLTIYRMWEYELAQTIHKQAQSIMNTVIVCPGPSTVFRSKVFDQLTIPTDTITEDMDLTFEMQRQNMGKIVYCSKATVLTQDPTTLKQFTKQVDRWYRGFWQCLIKHNIPWGGQKIDFEVAFLALEGLFNGLFVLSLFAFIPLSIAYQSSALLLPLALDILFFMIPSLLFVSYHYKLRKILLLVPFFYLIRFITSFLFLKSFLKVILVQNLYIHTVWNTTRYQARKEHQWRNLLYQTVHR